MKENHIIKNNEFCSNHKDKKLNYYFINCSEELCKLCKKEKKEKTHKIFKKENLIDILKKVNS